MARAAAALSAGAALLGVSAQAQTPSPPATSQPAADPLQAGSVEVALPDTKGLPAVEPIIPDGEFNAAIPALSPADDPELDRPLEPIDTFWQHRAAAPEASAAPAPTQSAASDPELTAPLPTLDAAVLQPTTFAQGEADQSAAEVGYHYRIDGIESADALAEIDLAGEFRRLSDLHRGKSRAANLAQLRSRLNEDALLARKLLAAEGWFDARVTTRIERAATPDGQPLTAVVDVAPGKRFAFSRITVTADPTEPADLIHANLPLTTGQPVIAERVIAAEAQVALALPQNGYPFAEVGQRDVLLDPDTAEAAYTLPVTVGPRGRYGRIVTEGKALFGADHVALLARFQAGEIYDSRSVDDLRQALVATGLFSAVAIEPRRSGEQHADGTEDVTIAVHQEAGPPRVLAATAGYGSGEGLHGVVSWTHRNMFPPEGALIVSGLVGTLEQGAGVTFRRSNAGERDRSFELAADLHHSTYDAFSAYTGRLAATISYGSTPLWQKRLGYAYGVQVLGTNESVFVPDLGARRRRTYAIGGLSGELKLDTTDSLLDPQRGFRLGLLAEPEGSLHGDFSPYLRLRLDGSAYRQLAPGLVLAGRVRVGSIQGVALDDLAPSRRFYAGGGGSVRGFGYQHLGPHDINADPTGGRSINEGAVELRYRFGDYGIAAFLDGGQVYRSTTPDFSGLRFGAGIGGRIYTAFGPVRFDLATPIKRHAGDGLINVYVSIGQAF